MAEHIILCGYLGICSCYDCRYRRIPLWLLRLGIGMGFLYAAVMLFQLVTLPVEFNASRRALSVIETTGMLAPQETEGAGKVLRAAAMTYVAAFAMSAANLLRLLLLARNRRD